MLRCAQSPRSNVLPKYACARRFFARLASETFLSSLQSEFFSTLLGSRLDHPLGIRWVAACARRLALVASKLPAANAQTIEQAAKVQLMPTAEAAVPMSTLPKDHKPRSMKNKLNTRPKRSDGVSIWIAVFDNARSAI